MNIALVLAAGKGTRMGAPVPKQFIEYKNKPILIYTLEAFARHPEIDEICVVCPADSVDFTRELLVKYRVPKLGWIAPGGASRRESSAIGVNRLSENCREDDIVLIHDGARPNVSARVISDNIRVAKEQGACETAVRSHDTIAFSPDGCRVERIPDRNSLFCVQTPQSFRLGVIHAAHAAYDPCSDSEEVTDDAGLILRNGGEVFLVAGDKLNLKITTEEDLRILYSVLE